MDHKSSSHLNQHGEARMVDVGSKPTTLRTSVARSRLRMLESTRRMIVEDGANKKGEILQIARLAGIQAAKKTFELIPLCHLVPLDSVLLEHSWSDDGQLEWTARVTANWRTGVEMEALVAASTAALTVYDMCKSVDRSMEVTHLGLWEKTGGKSGNYLRS